MNLKDKVSSNDPWCEFLLFNREIRQIFKSVDCINRISVFKFRIIFGRRTTARKANGK